jgi:aconitate hydratase
MDRPNAMATVTARSEDGSSRQFGARVRIDTPTELEIYRNGGILHMVLRQMLGPSGSA